MITPVPTEKFKPQSSLKDTVITSRDGQFDVFYKIASDESKDRNKNIHIVSNRASIPKKITQKREDIENEGLKQDIMLKKISLIILFSFLVIETVVVFAFTYFQATHWPQNFHLGEWEFRLVLTATILQITYMLKIAINHLFPNRLKEHA
jgi:hypothetical protein